MSEALLIMPNMRGGCATVGSKVHTLFRVNGRRPGLAQVAPGAEAAADRDDQSAGQDEANTSSR
ncbi:hypothetical protein SR870_09955 [Rhodopseudomonas palustris]|uniref:hypothetical protein n=1 Tax=Rhodopseudomonas palustris TaxID=1076 RepID=UPI002ACEA2BA|nr:hypothetical protein [Rhodopseudomonas palustris]WQH01564.1 hypothetical protein SR870_09955 [Rhodopseudomonas palustris]